MPRVIFHGSDSKRHELDVPAGQTLMEAAIDHGVAGIIGECGGACSCATCHSYIDENWLNRLPAIDEMEDGVLDAVHDRRANSRLACQIEISDDLDGLEVQAADNES